VLFFRIRAGCDAHWQILLWLSTHRATSRPFHIPNWVTQLFWGPIYIKYCKYDYMVTFIGMYSIVGAHAHILGTNHKTIFSCPKDICKTNFIRLVRSSLYVWILNCKKIQLFATKSKQFGHWYVWLAKFLQ